MRKLITYSPFALMAMPLLVSAQGISDLGSEILTLINNTFVPIIFALAFLVFIWGAFKYFVLAAGEADKEKAKNLMLYGLGGLFLMFAVWGIVQLLLGTFPGLNTQNPPEIPDLPGA